MERLLIDALRADDGVRERVAGDGQRIQWRRRNGAPAIALHLISGEPTYHLKGRTRFSTWLVQIDCWALSSADAAALRRAVIKATDGMKGAALQVFVQAIRTGEDIADGARQDGKGDLFRDSLDVRICTTEQP